MVTTEAKEKQREHLETEAAVSMDEDRLIKRMGSLAAEGRRLVKNMQVEESYSVLKEIEGLLPALIQDVKKEILEGREKEKIRHEDEDTTRKKKKAVGVIEKEKKYFEREYKIASDMHDMAKKRANRKLQEAIASKLKELERIERREQFRASVNKVKGRVNKLIEDLTPRQRQSVSQLIQKMKVFEADVLAETVQKLEPRLMNKTQGEIGPVGWAEIKQLTEKLVKDLQALVLLDQELEKIINQV